MALPGIPFELIPLRRADITARWPSARTGILPSARVRHGTAGLSVVSVSQFASQVFRRNRAYVLDAALPDLSL